MSFLAPVALWFAASIPVVVLFYLLKRKRVVHLVSSTLLWQKFLAETQASAPFQRLRHNWLLLLQILLLALAVFALSRPFFKGNAKETRLRVVVLDASASMQATDESPSRFEKSRAEALKWVDGLRDGEQMMVLLAGATTEVKQSPTTDKSALRRALQSCTPADTPTRLAEALKTAAAFTFEKRGEEEVAAGEIHLFSDGAATDLQDLANKNLPLVYHAVGQRANNVGIVSIDTRPNPEDPRQRAIFTSVANFSTNSQQAELELRFDNQLVEVKSLTLQPRETSPQLFLAAQDGNGIFSVHLAAQDDLAVDNQAFVVSMLPQPQKAMLVTAGNRFLEKAIRTLQHVELVVAPTLSDAARDFDLVILDNVSPVEWPAGNVLAFRVAHTNWFDGATAIETPPIVDYKATHPLLRFVTFDNVFINRSIGVRLPPWGVSLVDSPESPIIVAGELGRQRIVWVGFDVLESTWPYRVAFPIFIANAMDWLSPSSANANLFTVRAGDAFRMTFADMVKTAEVRAPDGTMKPCTVNAANGEVVFGDTLKQGVYRLTAGTNSVSFCVNLMDAVESDTTPKPELQFGRYSSVAASTVKQANVELWRWIAAAALAVLLFEWWFYHKRTA